MPGVVAFLATLVAATVIGQLMTQSLYDAATAVGDWGVKTKAGSTSLHSASARRHLCFFVNGLKDVGGCIYTRVKALLPDALSTMVCFVKKIVTGDMVHFRVHVNQAVKSPYARSLGRHADALLWPVFVAACVTHALWQLRVVIGTAPATLVFTIMVVDTKGRAMEKHGVFAMEQLVVPAYVAYMLTPMAAGQIDVGYVVIDGERLALRIFHCVLGVGYTRVAMIMTWLVDGEEGAEAARRRLKRLARTAAVANNPPPDCEFVPETAEEKRAMHLEVQRQKDRARDCVRSKTDGHRERKRREHHRRTMTDERLAIRRARAKFGYVLGRLMGDATDAVAWAATATQEQKDTLLSMSDECLAIGWKPSPRTKAMLAALTGN